MGFEQAIDLALKNIAKHGDTDIFPFPFETHVFFDRSEDCNRLLQDIHDKFDDRLYNVSELSTPKWRKVEATL